MLLFIITNCALSIESSRVLDNNVFLTIRVKDIVSITFCVAIFIFSNFFIVCLRRDLFVAYLVN